MAALLAGSNGHGPDTARWLAAGLRPDGDRDHADCAAVSPVALARALAQLFARAADSTGALGAADYLIRTGQAKKAVPYLERFQKSRLDDATWVAIRDRYGLGSILRLDDDPATRPFAQPAADALAGAARRYAIRPERIAQFVAELTQTRGAGLRRPAPPRRITYVPFLVGAASRPGLSAEERKLLVPNIGGWTARPSQPGGRAGQPRPRLGSRAATAGLIGDRKPCHSDVPGRFRRARPGRPRAAKPWRAQAGRSSQRPGPGLTAPPGATIAIALVCPSSRSSSGPGTRPRSPVREAAPRRDDRPAVGAGGPAGLQDRSARSCSAWRRRGRPAGRSRCSAGPGSATFAAATAGPSLLGEVLETAVADGKADLAAVAVWRWPR
jgi:hypothetical protein